MRCLSLLMIVCILSVNAPVLSQEAVPAATAAAPTAAKPLAFGLPDGSPVKMRTSRNLSSADAKTGETIDFEILEDIKAGEMVVVPKGSVAIGTVTRAKPKARLGRGGKLDINIDYMRTALGDKVALRAVKATKGYSSTAPMTGAIVASGILFFPAAPFFLFLKGKDIKIPKGTEVTAYVNGDTELDAAKYAAARTTPGGEIAAVVSGMASVSVKSVPEGAEIMIDGSFVGSTPSSIVLKPGEHTIVIKKTGFKTWERFVRLEAGSTITMNADLEAN